MKTFRPIFLAVFLAAAFVAPAATVSAEIEADPSVPNREVTGLEWFQMSIGMRTNYVLRSMAVLTKSGVALQRSPNEYYTILHERLRRDPSAYETGLTQLLAEHVRRTEAPPA